MKIERILIIQTAFLGDAVLTLPMIEKLKEVFPKSVIDVMCIPKTKEIFEVSPFVNEIIVIDKKKEHKSLLKLYSFSNEIKKRLYTKIFSPHRSFRTSFIVANSGVRETHGFSNSSMPFVYKNIVKYKTDVHEVQRNLDLIGYEYDHQNWRIVPKLKEISSIQQKINEYLSKRNIKGKLIAIAPGSIWETKKYPENFFKEIIGHFSNRSYKIIIIGGEADKDICERLASGHEQNIFSTAGHFSIPESIELLKYVKLLLTNDSAPTHLGVCADIPVLTIYCSTVPEFGFYPYNSKSSYISFNDLECKPCGIHGYDKCPLSTFDCGYKLIPNQVIIKMEEMLSD